VGRYIVRRLIESIPVIVLASLLVFGLLHLIPGDPASIMAGEDATVEEVAAIRERLGLNDPLPVQFGRWWLSLVQGDLGDSFRTSRPVSEVIRINAVPTLELALSSYVVTLSAGIFFGVMGGVRVRSFWDWGVSLSTVVFIAIPNFVFGIVLLWIISYSLGWLPLGGRVAVWEDPVAAFKYLLLPALTLGLTQAAVLARYTRTAVSQVTSQQYVMTARAKGLTERVVVLRHVLKNALIPTITLSGLQVAGILTGSVVIERVFSRPGLGRVVVDSVQARDIPTIQGVLLILVAVFILVNLVADLLYGIVDPRIRLERSR